MRYFTCWAFFLLKTAEQSLDEKNNQYVAPRYRLMGHIEVVLQVGTSQNK